MRALGCDYSLDNGMISVTAENDLHGASVYMDVVTVGATMNIILAAVKARGLTVIENAAREPHIVDLANFLNTLGADIRGAGTDTIKIHGVQRLRGAAYSIIPDQIEAGTYMVAAAATGGDVTVRNVTPKHLESISAKLVEMGVTVEEGDDTVRVVCDRPLKKCNVKTMPHPGFPTDMQPQITTLLSIAHGTSMVNESVWESNRFKYVDELRRMGAQITVDGKVAIVEGVDHLKGAPVRALDLAGRSGYGYRGPGGPRHHRTGGHPVYRAGLREHCGKAGKPGSGHLPQPGAGAGNWKNRLSYLKKAQGCGRFAAALLFCGKGE